jgi:hypothetical protein
MAFRFFRFRPTAVLAVKACLTGLALITGRYSVLARQKLKP